MTTMKLEIKDPTKADIFTNMFQNIKLFTDNMNISFEKEQFYVQGMDSSHVSIFEINIAQEWFDTYEIKEPSVIGVSTPIFHKILNTRSIGHQISMEIGETDKDRMLIEFTSECQGTFDKSFHMPLMDIDTDRMLIPETEYDLEFIIDSKKMKSIIDELSHFGDAVSISFKDDTVLFASETAAEGAMKLKASIEDFDSCTVDDEATISSNYATRYIMWMTHFHKINKTCCVSIKNGIPMQFKYPIENKGEENDNEDNTSNQNYVRFFLAPKITDDDE
jgi:proliferating cell nuclear antigen PCNA